MSTSALSLRLANEIMQMVREGEIAPGSHLGTQGLADRFGVSRSPVRYALESLVVRGLVEQRENRGYFAHPRADLPPVDDSGDPTDAASLYYGLAEDWLRDRIPAEVTEQYLRDRYHLTRAQLAGLLTRGANEGWIERKQGYGWRFLPVAKTPEALEQIYRFRAVIEPAALLEPTFVLDRKMLDAQRRIMEGMLSGGIERQPAERLLRAGARFHEDLVGLSGNPFFHQALTRANGMRRLLEYRSMIDRDRYYSQCGEHVALIDLLERGENVEASHFMRRHLSGAIARKAALQILTSARPAAAERHAALSG